MNKRGLTLLEVLVIVVVIGILAALLLPPLCGPRICLKTVACQSNLQQLYKLGTVYAISNRGEWPSATGEELWLFLSKTKPPLVEADHYSIYSCPLLDNECEVGETHYRGPRIPWSKLKPEDPIAADKEGNHGEGESINVLFKDGTVLEATSGDPLWRKCRELLQ